MTWDLIEEAKKLIGIPSVSTEGNRELVEYLIPFCQRAGFNITLQNGANGQGDREVNLLAHTVEGSPDLCPGGLLLVTHLDTVPAGEKSLWTETGGDPYRATIKGDKIFGLGSADTKLDFLCKLRAIETVGLQNLKTPLCLAGTYGEERALAGIRRLRESNRVHPRQALIGEPSELMPVLKHKGILYMRVVCETSPPSPLLIKERGAEGGVRSFYGKAAHGSTPQLGENAIEKACLWLFEEQAKNPHLQLTSINGGTVHNIVPEKSVVTVAAGTRQCPRLEFLKKFWRLYEETRSHLNSVEDRLFNPPVTTGNVGVIRTVDGAIEIEFDFRLIPATDGNELYAVFQQLIRDEGVQLEVISSNPPMDTAREAALTRQVLAALTQVGLKGEFFAKAGNTEGAIVSQMGAEAIVIGPGQSTGNIHRPNEYNEISQLNKAVEFYTAFLKPFC